MNPDHILAFVFLVLQAAVFASPERNLLSGVVRLNYYANLRKSCEFLTPVDLHQAHLAAVTDVSHFPFRIRLLLEAYLKKKEVEVVKGKKWISFQLKKMYGDSKGILRNCYEGLFINKTDEAMIAKETSHPVLALKYKMLLKHYSAGNGISKKIKNCVELLDTVGFVEKKIEIINRCCEAFWVIDHRFSGVNMHLLAFALLNIQHQAYAFGIKDCFKDVQTLWQKFNMRRSDFYPVLFATATPLEHIQVNRYVAHAYADATVLVRKCHIFYLPGTATFSVILGNAKTDDPKSPKDFELKSENLTTVPHLIIYLSDISDDKVFQLSIFLKQFFKQDHPLDAYSILDFLNALYKDEF